MIDPNHITKYNRTQKELEELALFCLAVAGKNATTTAKLLDNLLRYARSRFPYDISPFEAIYMLDIVHDVGEVMREHGFGCWKVKSKGLVQLARSGLNLRTCTVEDLEKIHGIGMKTARFFILHTRKDAQVACLDTHILQWLAYYTGHDIPRSTPAKKQYLELEQLFLAIAKLMKISPADLDLKIWRRQRGTDVDTE